MYELNEIYDYDGMEIEIRESDYDEMSENEFQHMYDYDM